MRLLSIVTAFSIVVIPAGAQMTREHLERFAQSLLAKQGGTTPACASTAGKQRLTNMLSNDRYQGVDETYFSYSARDRGSKFDFAYMTYPQFYESDNPVFYPSSIAMVNIMASSVEYDHSGLNSNSGYTRPQVFTYNKAGNITANHMYYYKYGETGADDVLIAADSDRYVYNPAGKLIEHYGMDLEGKTWQKTTRSGYEYDARGRLVADSMFYYVRGGGWEPARMVSYRYATGEILASAQSMVLMNDEWIQGERYDMDYYPDYRLRTISIHSVLQLRDSFVYTAAGTVQARYCFTSAGNGWTLAQAFINTLDTKGAIQSTAELVPAKSGKGFDTVHTIDYVYNDFGNPIEKVVYEKNDKTRVGYTEYTYETLERSPRSYDRGNSYNYRTAGIANTVNVKLYPNPASTVVYLELPNQYKGGSVTVFDAKGNTVASGTFAGGERLSINVMSLANGMYYYKVTSDNNSTATGHFVVQR